MVDRIQGSPVGASAPAAARGSSAAPGAPPAVSFADALAGQLGAGGIRLSAHAHQRLLQSGVALDDGAAARLHGAVQRAEQKGSRDSLVLLDDLAFVVSVANRTVITAVEGGRTRENVFTNIDSVVIG